VTKKCPQKGNRSRRVGTTVYGIFWGGSEGGIRKHCHFLQGVRWLKRFWAIPASVYLSKDRRGGGNGGEGKTLKKRVRPRLKDRMEHRKEEKLPKGVRDSISSGLRD